MGGPSLGPGQLDKPGRSQGVPNGHQTLGAGFEHTGRHPWQLHNQTAGSSGEGESCWAATTDPSPLRNSHPPNPKCVWPFVSCPCPTWWRIGFLRCCDPFLLPLIKMLSDIGLDVWVSSLLVVSSARGLCPRWGRWVGRLRLLVSWSFYFLLSAYAQPSRDTHSCSCLP